MTPFTLAHLSDPHLGPVPKPSFGELLGKRGIGYFNWMRNRRLRHSRHEADALVRDIKAQNADHIAVLGDLINLGLKAEFAPALDWMRSVGSPAYVTLVPGNHDSYVRETADTFATAWADYMQGDGERAVPAAFPFLQRRGPLALIGLCSAVPKPPFIAAGTLGSAQLEKLDGLLASLANDDTFRVLLIHHPLHSPLARWHKRLTDAPALLDILRKHGVDLVLHGHDHKHSLMWFDGPRRIPAVGVPSASAVAGQNHFAAAYNLFRISREANTWRCDWIERGFQSGKDGISELSTQRLA